MFEDYTGSVAADFKKQLERVSTLQQAEQIIESWRKPDYLGTPKVPQSEADSVLDTLKKWGLKRV